MIGAGYTMDAIDNMDLDQLFMYFEMAQRRMAKRVRQIRVGEK